MKPVDKTFVLDMKTVKMQRMNDMFQFLSYSCIIWGISYDHAGPEFSIFFFFCSLINIVPVAFGFSNCACTKERDLSICLHTALIAERS